VNLLQQSTNYQGTPRLHRNSLCLKLLNAKERFPQLDCKSTLTLVTNYLFILSSGTFLNGIAFEQKSLGSKLLQAGFSQFVEARVFLNWGCADTQTEGKGQGPLRQIFLSD